MLPFSLAVIVLILAVCQEIMLSPQKEELELSFKQHKSLSQESLPLLSLKVKTPQSLYIESGELLQESSAAPKFPR